ncbi:hypothetical protein ACLB2K_014452 [Fragaria x ananassa]
MDSCKGKERKIVPIVGASISVVVLLLLCAVTIFWIRERKKPGMKTEWSSKAKTWRFTYFEIVNITNNLTSVLGGGGFGRVYHGMLKDSTQVAVKVELLLGIHHKNVAWFTLFGYCNEGPNMALVYEYLTFGNLQQHLLADTSTDVLTWKGRLIAFDAAKSFSTPKANLLMQTTNAGLDYLHNCCKAPIVHIDLKTSSILLNEDMQAKTNQTNRICYAITT